MGQNNVTKLLNNFDTRQLKLIKNCQIYAANDPAGLPGHNLMMIIAQLLNVSEVTDDELDQAIELSQLP